MSNELYTNLQSLNNAKQNLYNAMDNVRLSYK